MNKTATDIIEEVLSGHWFVNKNYHPDAAASYTKIIRMQPQSGFETMTARAVFSSHSYLGFGSIENFSELSKLQVVEDEELIARLNNFAKKQLTIKSLNIGYSYLKEIQMLS